MKRYVIKSVVGYLAYLSPGGVAWTGDQRRALRVRGRLAADGMVGAAVSALPGAVGAASPLYVRRVALRWTP